ANVAVAGCGPPPVCADAGANVAADAAKSTANHKVVRSIFPGPTPRPPILSVRARSAIHEFVSRAHDFERFLIMGHTSDGSASRRRSNLEQRVGAAGRLCDCKC